VLIANGLCRFVGSVDDAVLPCRQDPEIGTQAAEIAVPSGGAERLTCGPDPRTGDKPFVDSTFERNVRAAFGAEIPDRGEAGLERSLRIDRRTHGIIHGAERDRFQDGVARAFGGYVRVSVDESREDGRVAQVDELSAARRNEAILNRDD
jgi:hypothetical protein